MTTAICPQCGTPFEVTNLRKKFCSRACVAASKKKPPVFNTCEICGVEFETNRFDLERGMGRFCSRRCKNIAQERKKVRNCEHCGRQFIARDSENKRYCSYRCSAHSRIKYKTCPICGKRFVADKGKDNKTYCSLTCKGKASRNYVIRTCENCGKTYETSYHRRKRFCSARCAKKFSMDSEFINTTYQGFTPSLKKSIRQRDNYACQLCGKTEQKREFSVHHVDYNKANCHPSNLITLCDTCHPKTHYNRAYWTEYFRSRHDVVE